MHSQFVFTQGEDRAPLQQADSVKLGLALVGAEVVQVRLICKKKMRFVDIRMCALNRACAPGARVRTRCCDSWTLRDARKNMGMCAYACAYMRVYVPCRRARTFVCLYSSACVCLKKMVAYYAESE